MNILKKNFGTKTKECINNSLRYAELQRRAPMQSSQDPLWVASSDWIRDGHAQWDQVIAGLAAIIDGQYEVGLQILSSADKAPPELVSRYARHPAVLEACKLHFYMGSVLLSLRAQAAQVAVIPFNGIDLDWLNTVNPSALALILFVTEHVAAPSCYRPAIHYQNECKARCAIENVSESDAPDGFIQ